MRIAITDDRASDLADAKNYIQEHIQERYPDAEDFVHIETFSSAEELLCAFEAGKYDILVLDIYMRDMSGMEAAKIIRARDAEVSIIFLTSSEEHVLEGYRVFATGYFIKPIVEHAEDFAETFDHIFPVLLEKKKSLSINVKGGDFVVPYRAICYVDINEKHMLCFHLSRQTIESAISYADCREALLADERFQECHHRVIINMDFVESMDSECFTMRDGTQVPISRRKRQDVKIAYVQHMIQR